MRGNVEKQVSRILDLSGIYQREVSYESDRRQAFKKIKATGGKATPHEISKQTGIYGNGTLQNVRSTFLELSTFIVDHRNGNKNIELVGKRSIEKFLHKKINDGVKYDTFRNILSVLTKVELILNLYAEKTKSGKTYNWSHTKKFMQAMAMSQLQRRANIISPYKYPLKLMEMLKEEHFYLVARIQYESGAKLSEATNIQPHQLVGLTQLINFKFRFGKIKISRSNKDMILTVTEKTYSKIVEYIMKHGAIKVSDKLYRDAIKEAAKKSHQKYEGTEGFRLAAKPDPRHSWLHVMLMDIEPYCYISR